MRINFHCIELTIQDEELGCTVTFSDSKSADDQFKTEEELMNSVEKYFMIQRTYMEDEDDVENYYLETSESTTDFDPREKMIINLKQNILEANWLGERVIIGLNLKSQELENLFRTMETKFNERITIRKQ